MMNVRSIDREGIDHGNYAFSGERKCSCRCSNHGIDRRSFHHAGIFLVDRFVQTWEEKEKRCHHDSLGDRCRDFRLLLVIFTNYSFTSLKIYQLLKKSRALRRR